MTAPTTDRPRTDTEPARRPANNRPRDRALPLDDELRAYIADDAEYVRLADV